MRLLHTIILRSLSFDTLFMGMGFAMASLGVQRLPYRLS